MRKLNQPHNKKGFTLIETLVAIFILLISTTGPLSFAQSGLRASFVARDQIVAFYLAQDAIETIKSLRDNASTTGDADGWLGTIKSTGCVNNNTQTQACQINTTTEVSLETCPGNVCEPLQFDDTTHQFTIDDGDNSKYTRTVYIIETELDREAQITVEVSWDTNFFADRRIIVQENIFNWVPNIGI